MHRNAAQHSVTQGAVLCNTMLVTTSPSQMAIQPYVFPPRRGGTPCQRASLSILQDGAHDLWDTTAGKTARRDAGRASSNCGNDTTIVYFVMWVVTSSPAFKGFLKHVPNFLDKYWPDTSCKTRGDASNDKLISLFFQFSTYSK